MDNDNKVVKGLKKIIKEIKFQIDYRDLEIASDQVGNYKIADMINNEDAAFVGRAGATEMRCVAEYLNNKAFSQQIREEISTLSGVFPTDDNTLKKFCETYIASMSQADILALWGVGAEASVVHEYCKVSQYTRLHALEPYYFDSPWSYELRGKKVLVIHPFSESIMKQYERREKIFANHKVLPEFKDLICLKAVQSSACETTEYSSWFEALEYMKRKIDKADFDVAVIGAGAYGLPLACYCKSIGKKAIQMSGATQILFGIKGRRWDQNRNISKFYNEFWIRPMKKETPEKSEKVEGGSYW